MKKLSILDNMIYWKYIESIDNTQKRHFDNLINEVDSIKDNLVHKYSIEELKLIKAHVISTENSIKDVAVYAVMMAFIFGLGAVMLQKLIIEPSPYYIPVFIISMIIIGVFFICILRSRNKTFVSTILVNELISSYLEEVRHKEENIKLKDKEYIVNQ